MIAAVIAPSVKLGLRGAVEDVVPARNQQQVLDDALDRGIGGVERLLAVAVVAGDAGLGAC